MAISKVQGAVGASGTTPVTASFTNTPAPGNLLIAYGWSYAVAASAASIPGFTLAVSAKVGIHSYIGFWYKAAGAGESKDVTITWTGSNLTYFYIEEWTGITSPALDKTAKTDTDGNSTHSRSSGTTDATTAANELVIACVATAGTEVVNPTWSNSYTAEVWATAAIFMGSLIVSSTGAQETTLSWTSPWEYAGGCIATFKSAAAYRQQVIMVT